MLSAAPSCWRRHSLLTSMKMMGLYQNRILGQHVYALRMSKEVDAGCREEEHFKKVLVQGRGALLVTQKLINGYPLLRSAVIPFSTALVAVADSSQGLTRITTRLAAPASGRHRR